MRREPLEIVMAFADFLKTTKEGETYSLNQIKDLTGLHYRTVQNYAFLIHHVQTKLPSITLEESGKAARIRITKNPSLSEFSLEDELVLYLFDKGAIRKSVGVKKPVWLPDVQPLIKERLIEKSELDETVSLTPKGMLRGAELADVREDLLIQPVGDAITESRKPLRKGEAREMIGDWFKATINTDFPPKIIETNPAVSITTIPSKEYATTAKDASGSIRLVDKARAM